MRPEGKFDPEIELTPGPPGPIDAGLGGQEETHAFTGDGREVLLDVRGSGGARGGYSVEVRVGSTPPPPPAVAAAGQRLAPGQVVADRLAPGRGRQYRVATEAGEAYTVEVMPEAKLNVELELAPGSGETIDGVDRGQAESHTFEGSGEELVLEIRGVHGAGGSYRVSLEKFAPLMEPDGGWQDGEVALGESQEYRIPTVDGIEYELMVTPRGRSDVELELTPGPGQPIDAEGGGGQEEHVWRGTGSEVTLAVRGTGGSRASYQARVDRVPLRLGRPITDRVRADESREHLIETRPGIEYIVRVEPDAGIDVELVVAGTSIDDNGRGGIEEHGFTGTGGLIEMSIGAYDRRQGRFRLELVEAPFRADGGAKSGEVGRGEGQEYRFETDPAVLEYLVEVVPESDFDPVLTVSWLTEELEIDVKGARGIERIVFRGSGDEVILLVTGHDGTAGSYSIDVTTLDEKVEPTTGLRLVPIRAGSFTMSADLRGANQSGYCDLKVRPHEVTITRPFWMAATETTIGQYRKCVEAGVCRRPRRSTGGAVATYALFERTGDTRHEERPVYLVTWEDADEFARWIGGRLPTEAEWEYAARGGTTGTRYWSGESDAEMKRFDWVWPPLPSSKVSGKTPKAGTQPVAALDSNPWGLHDVHGNVHEWVADWMAPLASTDQVDPAGPATGTRRVIRGGSWQGGIRGRHISACRYSGSPTSRVPNTGFRVVLPAAPLLEEQ